VDQTGLLNNVFTSANNIDDGRKGFAVPGKERQGRISYIFEKGRILCRRNKR
jgi:hypothetical protein